MPQKVEDKKAESQDPSKKEKKRSKMSGVEPAKFRSSIKRLAKEIYDQTHLSGAALDCFCGIAKCIVDDISDLSGELCKKVNRGTIGSQDIISAFQLILGKGELSQHCINEVKDVVAKSQLSNK